VAAGAVGNKGLPGLMSTTLLFLGSEQLKLASRATGIMKLLKIFMVK
jgi:hypothetical protein